MLTSLETAGEWEIGVVKMVFQWQSGVWGFLKASVSRDGAKPCTSTPQYIFSEGLMVSIRLYLGPQRASIKGLLVWYLGPSYLYQGPYLRDDKNL